MDIDLGILKLQYEILNASVEQLAAELNVPSAILQAEVTKLGWKQLWPDEPLVPYTVEDYRDVDLLSEAEQRAEQIAHETETYVDNARRRLRVYSLAKETLLAHRYLQLESQLIHRASVLVDSELVSSQDLKYLSNVYKDLRTVGPAGMANAAGISIGTDESGIPTAIIKDLTGQR